jgi:TolB-like protein
MMKLIFGLTMLLFFPLGGVFAQESAAAGADNLPRLAILPFSGGTGDDGEAIAELFSYQPGLRAVFGMVPRTTINKAITEEQKFQLSSGMTDPDTIAALGKQLGAQYVLSGTITSLGKQKLLVISILKIDDLRQVAGDIQTYTKIEDIQDKLPGMAGAIAAAMHSVDESLPKLAVVPVDIKAVTNKQAADVLAQILSIYIIKSGVYAVYPRTSSLEQVQEEYKAQLNGSTSDKTAPAIGHADNPPLVLSVVARSLGSRNMFNASIINMESGIQPTGGTANYNEIDDGMKAMNTLAAKLTGKGIPTGIEPGFGAKLGYGALNILGGLGSYLEGDIAGGVTMSAAEAAAVGCFVWEFCLPKNSSIEGLPAVLGCTLGGAAVSFGFCRPFMYHPVGTDARLSLGIGPGAKGKPALQFGVNQKF